MNSRELDNKILTLFVEQRSGLKMENYPAPDPVKIALYMGKELTVIEERIDLLVREKLLNKFERGKVKYVDVILPEGRIVLERIQNNSWLARWGNRAVGALFTLVSGLLLAYLTHARGW